MHTKKKGRRCFICVANQEFEPKLAFVKLSLNLSKKYPRFFQMYLWKRNNFPWLSQMYLWKGRQCPCRGANEESKFGPAAEKVLECHQWRWWDYHPEGDDDHDHDHDDYDDDEGFPPISSDDEIIMRMVIPLFLSWRRWIWWCCCSWSWWWSSSWLWLCWWLESWGSWRWRQWQWPIQTSKSSVGVNSQAGTSPQDISRFKHNDHQKWGPSMTIISSSSIIIIWPSYHSYDHHIIIINDHHMTMKDRDESSGYQQIHTQHNDQYDHRRHTIIDMTSKEFFPSPFPQSLILLYSVRYILLAVFSLEHRLNTAGTKTKHDRDIDRWYSQHNT